MSEDCLYLNVIRPANYSIYGEPLPVGVWIYACSHHYDGRGDSDKVIGGTDKRGGGAIWGRPGGGEGQMGLGEAEGSHEGRVGKMMGIRLVALRWVDTRRSGQNRFPVDDCGRTSFPG